MLTVYKKTALVVCLGFLTLITNAQLEITPQTNAQALAQRLVGDGITISNVTMTASPLATGYFKNTGGTQLGIDSGIVFSTGRVLSSGTLRGLNGLQSYNASTTHNTPGDAQLSAIINGAETNDAVVLEFDFIPVGDTVKFRYVFSSEEYPTFTCSNFNDAFAFFISGPGITGAKNIALVPGTNIPVSINSINDGTDPSPGLCNAMGPGSPFVQYFVNNTGGQQFTHNGHTTVLTAISSVVPCQTYHLKLVIADVFDHIYDSGVFLEAKSLISSPLHIINANPVSNGIPFMVEGCTPGAIQISRTNRLSFPQDITLSFAGNAVNGTDVLTIPTTVTIPANDSVITVPITPIADNVAESIEELKIYVSYSSCGASSNIFADSIIINLRDQLNAVTQVQDANCTVTDGTITLDIPVNSGAPPYQYSINGGTFQSANSFSNLAQGNYIINITDSIGCVNSFTATVGLNNTLTVSSFPADTSICEGASFTPRVQSNATSYSWTPSAGVSSSTAMEPTITAGDLNTQFIITAVQGSCQAKDTISVT
ncbi:MAG TPA: choice-of-anchor L domain-containing protein, partial [Flavisolibacter sp.]